jgi:hypothetical protein
MDAVEVGDRVAPLGSGRGAGEQNEKSGGHDPGHAGTMRRDSLN